MDMQQAIEMAAKICHQANKAYCECLGDTSQVDWEQAEQWQRDSAIAGVQFAITNRGGPASAQHEAWMQQKIEEGWIYGPVKDPELKQHPCLVPFNELPEAQQKKDLLFKTIVETFI